jgi:hypothetical protein
LILQHGWQPKRTFRHAQNGQVVPKWYSRCDHLREVLNIYVHFRVNQSAEQAQLSRVRDRPCDEPAGQVRRRDVPARYTDCRRPPRLMGLLLP